MKVQLTGVVSAPIIPVGTQIVRAYWTASPSAQMFPTKDLALEYALAYAYAPEDPITIDFWWGLASPSGVTLMDLSVQRNEYATSADAQAALALYQGQEPADA